MFVFCSCPCDLLGGFTWRLVVAMTNMVTAVAARGWRLRNTASTFTLQVVNKHLRGLELATAQINDTDVKRLTDALLLFSIAVSVCTLQAELPQSRPL